MQLSKEQDVFYQFPSAFLKSRLNVEHFQKKMTLIAYVFPKLQTAKDVVRDVSKDLWTGYMVNGSKHC